MPAFLESREVTAYSGPAGPIAVSQHTRAPLVYAAESAENLVVHSSALTGSTPRFLGAYSTREVDIRDARPIAAQFSLEREGFELMRHEYAEHDLTDDLLVRKTYYPEVEELLKAATGADRVYIFDHTWRRDDGADSGSARPPARHIHNDYTDRSGAGRSKAILRAAEELPLEDASADRARIAQVNVWRPLSGPVLRSPLALLDATSVSPEDLVTADLVYPDRTGEIYHVRYSQKHRWYYFPKMQPDEVLLIKGYDSLEDGRARFTPHTAFEHPDTPADAPPRESLEVRTFLVFQAEPGKQEQASC